MIEEDVINVHDPMTEEEIRLIGLDNCDNVERAFLWKNLSRQFIRQLAEYDKLYKTKLQHHLIWAFNGYATYSSVFYSNMWVYLQLGLAEQKQLVNYADRLYRMYREQAQNEWAASRQTYKFVDGCGVVRDQIVL